MANSKQILAQDMNNWECAGSWLSKLEGWQSWWELNSSDSAKHSF